MQDEERCEHTDMLKSQCAHCLQIAVDESWLRGLYEEPTYQND